MTATISERLIPVTHYTTPTTGSTVTAPSNGYVRSIINPAGTLLALTYTLPSSPSDADVCEICSSQIITGLTMNGGTIVGALTTLVLGGFASFIYNATAATWFRNG